MTFHWPVPPGAIEQIAPSLSMPPMGIDGPFDIDSYDHIVVAFSGGKDSLACLLALITMGVDLRKVELWHHLVDGRDSQLMDWPVTEAYVRAVGEAFGIPVYMSWRQGGLEREMLREDAPTAAVSFQIPGNMIRTCGGTSKKRGTRLRFPQVSADLSVRWCSASAKIDVASVALNNQERFIGARTLFVTGERAEESPGRARYNTFEPHRNDNRDGPRVQRHIDHWRPIHALGVAAVWALIGGFKVNPHPVYDLSIGRCSCSACIFADYDQLATIRLRAPELFRPIADYEKRFATTIHRTLTLDERADRGTPYPEATPEMMERCLSRHFREPIFIDPWRLPAGALRASSGPT